MVRKRIIAIVLCVLTVFAYMPLLPYQAVYAAGSTEAQQELDQAKADVAAKEKALSDAQAAQTAANAKVNNAGKAFLNEKAGSSASIDRLVQIFSADSELSPYMKSADFKKALNAGLTVDALLRAADLVAECNSLRAKHGLAPLKINYRLMNLSAISAAVSANKREHVLIMRLYSGVFDDALDGVMPPWPAENLAWRYGDPFDGWYTYEKAQYDKYAAMSKYAGLKNMDAYSISVTEPYSEIYGDIGHYLNIVDGSNVITGFSSNGSADEQSFSAYDDYFGASVTPAQFKSELNAYAAKYKNDAEAAKQAVTKAQNELQTAKNRLAQAQAAVDATKSKPKFTATTTIRNTIANSAKKTNDVIWDRVSGADKYIVRWREITRQGNAKAWQTKTVGNTIRTSTTGLKIKSLYEIRVQPVKAATATTLEVPGTESKSVYRYFYTVPKIRLKSNGKGQFTMSWARDKDVTSYQVMYTTNKNGAGAAKNIHTTTGSSLTVKGLKSGQTYYVQVRAIKTVGGRSYIGNISCPVPVKVR